jgi:hypothetical protein
MKKMLVILCIALAAIAMMSTNAFAFHDQTVARCNACHTMHNSENGALVDATSPNGNAYLLIRSTPTEVCLTCHADHLGAVWGADPVAPPAEKGGGNFCFVTEDNINDGSGSALIGSYGVHNCIAPAHGGIQDPTLAAAPGGTYPASALGCTSCHNPHGNTNFRLLYGAGHVEAGDYDFDFAAPTATGISINSGVESPASHTAYRGGMSQWCANCHGDYHDNSTKLIHPSGVTLGGSIAQTYGLYNGTNQTPGSPATSYIPQVAFEDAAMTTTSTGGPTASSQVSCITCHRAHGSSAPNLGRWDFNVASFATEGRNGSYALPNPYAATAGTAQRSLCNKCHEKD